jgi:hypothetical protein
MFCFTRENRKPSPPSDILCMDQGGRRKGPKMNGPMEITKLDEVV